MYLPLVLVEAWNAKASLGSISMANPRSFTSFLFHSSTCFETQLVKVSPRIVAQTLAIHCLGTFLNSLGSGRYGDTSACWVTKPAMWLMERPSYYGMVTWRTSLPKMGFLLPFMRSFKKKIVTCSVEEGKGNQRGIFEKLTIRG